MLNTVKILALTTNRGRPRFWAEGRAPERSGFKPGSRYVVVRQKTGVLLKLDPAGDRKVSKKVSRTGGTAPILDINSSRDLAPLAGLELVKVVFSAGRVYISPLASETRRRRRLERLRLRLLAREPLATAGIAAGGGILSHALHAGFEDAGVPVRQAAHNEIREDLSDHAFEHNDVLAPKTQMLNLPLQELAFDVDVLQHVEEADIVELGLPCSGASKAGRAKRSMRFPEEHPLAGHLVVGALALLTRLNPAVAVFENVVSYGTSASAVLIRQHLRDIGYEVQERTLYGPDFGELEQRTRWCLVAVTKGIPLDVGTLPLSPRPERRLSQVLEAPLDVASHWSQMTGLKRKQGRDAAKGSNFKMQVFDGSESGIGTLTSGMGKNRSTDPKIRHPADPSLLRVPTPAEHARCKGVPESLINGLCVSKAHQLLGQGIVYGPFRHLARHIGEALRAWAESQAKLRPLPTRLSPASAA